MGIEKKVEGRVGWWGLGKEVWGGGRDRERRRKRGRGRGKRRGRQEKVTGKQTEAEKVEVTCIIIQNIQNYYHFSEKYIIKAVYTMEREKILYEINVEIAALPISLQESNPSGSQREMLRL